jgi:hypothetical protein
MLKLNHQKLVLISGLVWLAIGCFLLPLGLNLVIESLLKENAADHAHPLLTYLSSYAGNIEQAALISVALSLSIGFLKGRYVFAKTVSRSVNRILSLPNPAPITQIYAWYYYLLLGSMGFLGVIVRYLPNDIRGCVDIVIGAALINGAALYFKEVWKMTIASRITCDTVNRD